MEDLQEVTEEALETEDPQNADESEHADPEKFEKERYNQIVQGKTAEVKKFEEIAIKAAIKSASIDAESLIELHKEDPKLAEKVATRMKDTDGNVFKSYKDAERYIKKLSSSQVQEDDRETWYRQMRAKEVHEEALQEAYEMFDDLPDDVREQAISEFDDMRGDIQLTRARGEKYAEAARLLVSKWKDSTQKLADAKVSVWSSWLSAASKKSTPSEPQLEWDDSIWSFVRK